MYRPIPALGAAARDYRWLLDRGYSAAAALKLVGDRFQLPREERMILFRGVAPTREAEARRAILSGSARSRLLVVDGHNQALAVMHYLAGRPVFIASDGLVRDAGGSHGRIAKAELFDRALALLASRIAEEEPSRVIALFDAPIPKSAGHCAAFRAALEELGIAAEARTESSADAQLKEAPAGALVATSDSAVVDAIAAKGDAPRIFDAARAAIDALRERSRDEGAAWLDMALLLGAER